MHSGLGWGWMIATAVLWVAAAAVIVWAVVGLVRMAREDDADEDRRA
jgi:hypothetical protein